MWWIAREGNKASAYRCTGIGGAVQEDDGASAGYRPAPYDAMGGKFVRWVVRYQNPKLGCTESSSYP